MFYYSMIMYNEQTGQWFEWCYFDSLIDAKKEFNRLTGLGRTVKVTHCRDLTSGDKWIGE